jgi:uncharacterized membrane protein
VPERSDTAASTDAASPGASHGSAREGSSEKPQRTPLLARLGAALPWSELALAIGQLSMVSGSLLLAAHLFLWPEAQRAAFLAGNQIDPVLRSKLLVQLLAALALPVAAAAGLLARYGRTGARWLIGAATRLCPLLVACFVPTLLDYDQWYSQPLPYLAMLLGVVLLLERLLERALRGTGTRPIVAALPSAPPRQSHLVPLAFVLLFALAYSLQASYFSIIRHRAMQSAGFDLGIFDNLMFNAMHFRPFRSTVAVPHGSYLSNHAEYGMFLFAPLYALYPRADTLLVLQSCFIGFAAVPLYFFASTRLPRPASAALACVYPFYAPLHGPNFYDFHWMPVSMLFFFWLFYAIARRQKLAIVLLFLVICAMREDAPFGLVATGLFLIVTGEWPLLGAIMSVIASLWFVLVKFVIMPWAGPWWFANIYKDLVAAGESGYGSVVKTILINPNYFVKTLLNETKLVYTLHLLAPLALLPVRRAALWLLMLPGFFVTLMTTGYAPTTSITFQYTTHWAPFLFGAAVIALGLRGERHGRPALLASLFALCFGVLCHSYVFGSILQHEKFVGGFSKVKFTLSESEKQRYQDLRALADMIPRTASVAATELEIPHISNRLDAYSLKVDVGRPDYLLFSRYHLDESSRNELRKALKDADFGLIASKGEYYLFNKGHNAPETEAALKQLGLALVRAKPRRRESGSVIGPGGKCLAVDAQKKPDAFMRDCDRDSLQRWQLSLETGRLRYRPQPDKCLGMSGRNNGDILQLESCAQESTRWAFERITIRAYAEMCVDLLGGNTQDGAEIGVWDCLDNENQKWTVTPAGEIRWAGGLSEARCLAVQGAQDGTPVSLQRCDGSASQKFSFSANKIRHAGKCIDLRPVEDRTRRGTAELPGNGWRALLFACAESQTNQEWHFSGPLRQAGKCADNRHSAVTEGLPVTAWDCVDRNQVWDVHF